MNELSLHILDIVGNSFAAKSTEVIIQIIEDPVNNTLTIAITDNGCGIEKENIEKLQDPFYTTRTTRKVGLGIPLFLEQVNLTDGSYNITSIPWKETTIEAVFLYDHIDRLPIGDMSETLVSILLMKEECEVSYVHRYKDKQFSLHTKEIEIILDGVSIRDYAILQWIKSYIKEGIQSIYKEVL